MALTDNSHENSTKLIKPFSFLSGLDMALEDNKGLVLGGTGIWTKRVGTYRPEGSYFDLTLKTGEPYACTDPKFSPQCYKCPIRSHCPYSITASYPIIFDGEVKGLIGYLGYEKIHRDQFLEKKPVLMKALEELTSLVPIIDGSTRRGSLRCSSALIEDILNEMYDGIIFLDSRLRVTYVNKAASLILDSKPGELLGKKLNTRLPEVENEFKQFQKANTLGLSRIYKKINTKISNRSQGLISLHQWNEPETRFIIFKDYFAYNQTGALEGEEFEGIVGDSEAINYTKRQAKRLAETDASILIFGETGSGKELFANAIHRMSHRYKMPFVIVNCAAIPETLAESELFGYECGAFSGANQSGKPGKFEVAHGGTLFLDEIGELPLNAQSKLLRAVEQMEIEKVGAVQPTKIDIRIIAATNRDLKTLVGKGKFREDLYYRLNILPLNIPALRERREDIPFLMGHFLKIFGMPQIDLPQSLTTEIMGALITYDWPGNVRELKNTCQYLAVNYTGRPLLAKDLPPYMRELLMAGRELNKLPRDCSQVEIKHAPCSKGAMESVNRVLIIQALSRFGHTTAGKRRAASSLGISLSTLYRKIKQYNI